MSILLDALKRSESQREIGSVPTLQTNTETAFPAMEKAPAWLPFGMVLVAATLMTWMGLGQFRFDAIAITDGQTQQQVELTPGASILPPVQAVDVNTPAARESILPKLAESASAPTVEQQQTAEPRVGRQIRDYTAAQTAEVGAQANEPTRDNAVRRADVSNVELDSPSTSVVSSPNPAATDHYEPQIINYWQVPEKMREGLPDLRISVLVYAELPENRFVLMNGERLREGQELSNGLLLEEIQRDRAIFNYRNYRFYLKS